MPVSTRLKPGAICYRRLRRLWLRTERECNRELTASRTVCLRSGFSTKVPAHEQGCTKDRTSDIRYEVPETAMALAGEALCQLNIDSHGQHCA